MVFHPHLQKQINAGYLIQLNFTATFDSWDKTPNARLTRVTFHKTQSIKKIMQRATVHINRTASHAYVKVLREHTNLLQ